MLCFDSIGTNLVKLRNAYFFRVVVCFSEFSGKLPVFIFTADYGKTLQEAGAYCVATRTACYALLCVYSSVFVFGFFI